ncbi:MAG: ABC transporter ATP-binding protein [Magnetovibrio sp.]|nr:ABC transporter ATP-binding protein [Magnetovibrio sp.]
MLKLKNVFSGYGKSLVLQGLDLEVDTGEAVALLGRNGVGKTTTLRTIMGLTPSKSGEITFEGHNINNQPPHTVPRQGIGYVPQGRHIFPNLSVMDNLCIGLRSAPTQAQLIPVFARFPRLEERSQQLGGTLSGGEQQMLAIARCLIMGPKILLLDEPTEGIMPKLVAGLRDEIKAINETGVSVLFVEQNIRAALAVCSRVYIMEKGIVSYEGTAGELKRNPEIVKKHLGVSL